LSRKIILLLFFLSPIILFGFNTADSLQLNEAFTPEQIRSFDVDKLNDLKANKGFQYYDNSQFSFEIIGWLIEKISNIIEWIFGDVNDETGNLIETILEILLWLLFIFILVFGIIKMLGIKVSGFLFKPSDVKADIPFSIIDENIHELDFDVLIEQALIEKNYRYAVRLNYLKVLKLLADDYIIEWKKNKTNNDYLTEVRNTEYYATFSKLTRTFNYIWYGDKNINLTEYQMIQVEFSNFTKQAKYELD